MKIYVPANFVEDEEAGAKPLRERHHDISSEMNYARRSAILSHSAWMSHAISAHNKRLATMMKMRVFRPLQRLGR
jgi:hypothetical protein